jgi:hypothetical protein
MRRSDRGAEDFDDDLERYSYTIRYCSTAMSTETCSCAIRDGTMRALSGSNLQMPRDGAGQRLLLFVHLLAPPVERFPSSSGCAVNRLR